MGVEGEELFPWLPLAWALHTSAMGVSSSRVFLESFPGEGKMDAFTREVRGLPDPCPAEPLGERRDGTGWDPIPSRLWSGGSGTWVQFPPQLHTSDVTMAPSLSTGAGPSTGCMSLPLSSGKLQTRLLPLGLILTLQSPASLRASAG